MFKCRIMVVLRLMRNEKFWGFLGREALGSWVRELGAGLDFRILGFSVCFLFGQNGVVYHMQGHQIISIATMSF